MRSKHRLSSRVAWGRALARLTAGALISSTLAFAAAAQPPGRGRQNRGGVSVWLVLPHIESGPARRSGRDHFGRDVAEMRRYHMGLRRRGIADLDPDGTSSLSFRVTNHRSVPVVIRFSGIQQPLHSRGHLQVVSATPAAARLAPGGAQVFQLGVASPSEADGAAVFSFEARAGHRPPERIACRVRYTFDRYSE